MSNKKQTPDVSPEEEAALFAKFKALSPEKKAAFKSEQIEKLKLGIKFDAEELAHLAGGAAATEHLRKVIAEIQVPVPGGSNVGRVGGVR